MLRQAPAWAPSIERRYGYLATAAGARHSDAGGHTPSTGPDVGPCLVPPNHEGGKEHGEYSECEY